MTEPALTQPLPRRSEWEDTSLVYLAALIIYTLLSIGPATPYNAHVLLANAWLSGHVSPPTLPTHIEHAIGPNGTIIAYGPGPALLLLPFVAILGLKTNQSVFCTVLGAINVALVWSVLTRMGTPKHLRLALTLLFGLGSPHLFNAVQSGNTWPMMHVVTVFGLLVALRSIFSPPTLLNGLAVGLGLGLAYLTRQPVLLAIPFIVLMALSQGMKALASPDGATPGKRTLPWKLVTGLMAGFALCLAFSMAYNWARMGNPLDGGYERVNLVITPPHLIPHGNFSLEYLPRNLHAYFLSGPERIATFPFFRPSQFQMSMLLVFPALLMIPLADWRKRVNWLALGGIAAMMALYLVYYWTGATQFGMRYTLDWLPLAMLLIASAGQGRLPLVWFVTILGIAVETWGLVMWRVLGWT